MAFRPDPGGIFTRFGTGHMGPDPAPNGQASFKLDGSSNYLRASSAWHPAAIPATIFAVIYRPSATLSTAMFATGYTGAAYRGISASMSTTGTYTALYGDGGGSSGADRRTGISSFAQAAGTVATWSVTITAATDFTFWMDGRKDPGVTYTGSGAGMSTNASGVFFEMGRNNALGSFFSSGGYLMLGIVDGSWSDTKHAAFHENPWQVLRPYRRPIYFDAPAAGTFKAAWARNANAIISTGAGR